MSIIHISQEPPPPLPEPRPGPWACPPTGHVVTVCAHDGTHRSGQVVGADGDGVLLRLSEDLMTFFLWDEIMAILWDRERNPRR